MPWQPRPGSGAAEGCHASVRQFGATSGSLRECLDHYWVFGKRHLRHILSCSLGDYHRFRPHPGLGNVSLTADESPPTEWADAVPLDQIVCRDWLGGLLKH